MKIENLRTLIRESINEYIKEIDEAAETAAMEARIAKCDEAIQTREAKLGAIAESEHSDLIDENKVKNLENEIKELKKAKAKFEKAAEKKAAKKAKKSAPKEEEVVTDAVTEEAPIDETDVMAEMDVEETAINESFLKMQKLAGVITEAQYNQKKSLVENQLNEDNLEVKSIAKKLYSWLKQNGVAASLATQNVNFKQIGIKDPKQQEATIYVFDDPSTKQTIIRVSLRGKESIVKDIENKLLTTYPGLEEFNKQQYKLYSGGLTNSQEIPGAINLTFDLKEKTTAKGGLVGNTQTK